MTTIDQIVETALNNASKQMIKGNLNLKSIIYQAVQQGMADAYQRGANSAKENARQAALDTFD